MAEAEHWEHSASLQEAGTFTQLSSNTCPCPSQSQRDLSSDHQDQAPRFYHLCHLPVSEII